MESFCLYELRLSPKEFYCLTLREYQLRYRGYIRDMERMNLENLEAWRRTRLISFFIIGPHLEDKNQTIYNFMPLPDDPTDEEIEKAKADRIQKDSDWQKKVIEYYKNKKAI